jgi:hypothetical protein
VKHLQQQQLDASLTLDKRMRAQLITMAASRAESEMRRILLASGRSFMSLFHGLQILWVKGTESAQPNHGAATFACIQAFDTLLCTVTSVCELIAKQDAATSLVEKESSTLASKTKQATTTKRKKAEAAPIPHHLAMFIRMLLGSLTPIRDGAHAALYEGVLYHLFNRTGKRLFSITFDHERSASIAGDIDPTRLTKLKAKAVRIEARLLVELLESALKIAPAFLGSLATTTAALPKARGRPRLSSSKSGVQSKATISIAAKETLQATLIHCMFGEETRDNFEDVIDDDAKDGNGELVEKHGFLERLRRPPPMLPLVQSPKVEDEGVSQWFREEVWRLIGWDLLGRSEQW